MASLPTGCRRSRSSSRAKPAAAAVGQGVPSMHPGRRAAATGRLEAPGTKTCYGVIVVEFSLLGTHGTAAVRGVRCRARRAATTRQGVLGEAWHPRQPIKVCRRSRRAQRAGAAVRRGVPSITWTGRAAAARRIEAPPPSLLWCAASDAQFVHSFSSNWLADKPPCRG